MSILRRRAEAAPGLPGRQPCDTHPDRPAVAHHAYPGGWHAWACRECDKAHPGTGDDWRDTIAACDFPQAHAKGTR